MTMSLAELDAEEVTLLPERATLKGSFISVYVVRQTAIANAFSLGGYGNENVASAGIFNF